MTQNLIKYIKENTETVKNKVAIFDRKGQLTYGELISKVQKIAGYFITIGLKKGEIIVLEGLSEIDYVLVYLAAQQLGAITAPVERGIRDELLNHICHLITPKYFISNTGKQIDGIECYQYKEVIDNALYWDKEFDVEINDNDRIAEIIFTTGTTGKPKASLHTAAGVFYNTMNTVNGVGIKQTDTLLVPLPLNHSFGMRVLRASLVQKATVVLHSGAIFAKSLIEAIENYHCTAMSCVSATMESVLNEIGEAKTKEAFSNLRFIEFSAGAVPTPLRKKLVTLLSETDILNTWGSSETGGCLFINLSKNTSKIESAGKALNGTELGILSETGKFLTGTGKNVTGRLAIKGEMIFKGYYNQDDESRDTLRNGWLVTKDIVWRDEEGYYYILGRSDDLINIGGEKVSPAEIENAARESKLTRESACIAIADQDGVLGQVPLLIYTTAENQVINEKDLAKKISAQIGAFRTPRQFLHVQTIPKNYMKKTNYKLLKELWTSGGSEEILGTFGVENIISQHDYDLNNIVIETILNRRSRRRFLEESIPDEIINKLVELGTSAPSGKNLQTRQFTVISNKAEIERLKEITKTVAKREGTSFNGFVNPPLLILISNDRKNKDGIQDVGVAAENILIGAESLGMAGVWLNPLMEISDEEEIRTLLDTYLIPSSHIVWAVMAIGWPNEEIPQFTRKANVVNYIN